jgi:hypothetical protein
VKWRKLGLLWAPRGDLAWTRSHAMVPTPIEMPDGGIRLLLGCLDAEGIGRIGWIDLDARDPRRVTGAAEHPLLDIGAPGCFDDNGVVPASAVRMPDGSLRLYFFGFQLLRRVPYAVFTGLAQGDADATTFRRVQETPVLDRVPGETLLRSAPCVRPAEGGGWRAWYVAGSAFVQTPAGPKPTYGIRHAVSEDGIAWQGTGEVLAPAPGELGFGRPWMLREGDGWRAWYSVRTAQGYSIGTAVSADGLAWTRCDAEVGIAATPGDWDGEMICYATVFDHGGTRWMVHNGDGYGRTGVGLAVLEHA